jgi:hypothetical protein
MDFRQSNGMVAARRQTDFEQNVIDRVRKTTGSIDPLSVVGWMMTGAIREDDAPRRYFVDNPQDDPYDSVDGDVARFRNHFYDPVHNRPLTVASVALGQTAPTWATGAVDAFAQPNQRDSTRRNHFTVFDVKEAMFRALTLKATDSLGNWIDLAQPPDPGGKEDMRNAYWASVFRGLGDVLHLVQDMAQPQHTRNDQHGGVPPGHKSIFEAYLDARARGAPAFSVLYDSYVFRSTVKVIVNPLTFQVCNPSCVDYPTPTRFAHYSDFFSTAPGSAVGGQGLADYSNTQFFSAGKNFGNTDYASPPSSLASYSVTTVTPTHWDGSPIDAGRTMGPISLYSRTVVVDNQDPAFNALDVPLTTRSMWDDFITGPGSPGYHLTREVYDAQAALLLPRAVAYGVGLLRHLFRGGLEISLPDAGAYAVADHTSQSCRDSCGFSKVRLKLRNTTSTGEGLGSGAYFAVAKFRRNNCYRPDLSGDPGAPSFGGYACRSASEEIVVSDPVYQWQLPNGSLAAGEQQTVNFSFATPIPINATDIQLQVVFRGRLGDETDAVVVTTKNISEPNYIAVVNDLDYRYSEATDTFQSTDPLTAPQTITNIDVKLGGATSPVATLSRLNVREYAQLALLTDLGTSATEKLVIDFSAAGMSSPLTFSNFPIATFAAAGYGNYDRSRWITSYRGMWSDYRFDVFSGYAYGLAPCGPSDTRRICTSAGLTTIPSSNAVAWSVNFP